jgi:anthraniloyl-CoA monooxygenase
VRNARWHHGRTVLLGDALHTAHFSIGSGTKLALGDAIELAQALGGGGGVEEALERFERARRPTVEAYQEAAFESLLWFENMAQYRHLSPLSFAYTLMTRSKKIDREKLKARDPDFVSAYEASAS